MSRLDVATGPGSRRSLNHGELDGTVAYQITRKALAAQKINAAAAAAINSN